MGWSPGADMCFSYDRLRRALPLGALVLSLALPGCEAKRDAGAGAISSEPAAERPLPGPLPKGEGTENGEAGARGPLVVFLGDSLAAGLHLPAEQAFPAVIQRALAREGVPFRLVNAGVSGDTTTGGLSRVAWIMKQKPRLVVLELGSNDGMRGLPLRLVEDNLRAIIAKIRAGGADVLLLGMRLPPSFGGEYADGFAALFERVAQAEQVAFVPFFHEGVAGVPELNLPDGIHPTEQGHRRIAARLAPRLAERLRAVAQEPDAGR